MALNRISPAFSTEVAVIGAGVVGLAVARALALCGKEVLIVDRAPVICSGRCFFHTLQPVFFFPSQKSILINRFCIAYPRDFFPQFRGDPWRTLLPFNILKGEVLR